VLLTGMSQNLSRGIDSLACLLFGSVFFNSVSVEEFTLSVSTTRAVPGQTITANDSCFHKVCVRWFRVVVPF
jgi:hypothetical protein